MESGVRPGRVGQRGRERERAGEETELVRECEQKNRTQIQTAQQAHKIE